MSVSKQLLTYPSHNLTITILTVFGLGEELMRSCLDTDINIAYSLQFETTSKQTVHIKRFPGHIYI